MLQRQKVVLYASELFSDKKLTICVQKLSFNKNKNLLNNICIFCIYSKISAFV